MFVQYCFDDKSEQKKWDITTVKDLSESGVCLQTGKLFDNGSDIRLRFKIPSRPLEPTEISATVVSCQPIGQSNTFLIRARFINLNDDIVKVLRDYVLWMVKNRGSR